MSRREYVEHYTADEPPRIERRYRCECCGYPTLGRPNDYESCEVCDWMDDHAGDGGPGPEPLPEARENFRARLTKYRPGTRGKRALIAAYDRYLGEPDPRRRTPLWSDVRRASDAMS